MTYHHSFNSESRFRLLMTLASTVVFFTLLSYGCRSDEDLPNAPNPRIEPKLSSIQENIFTPSCGTVSCHGGNAGDLNLLPGNSFGQLVNVASQADGDHNPTFLRVKPGSPDSSFLYIKITNPSANQGSRMPQTGGRLSDAAIGAIRTWIQNGALNN